MLEVPHATVDETRGPARGSTCEVGPLDQRHAQPAHRRVSCNPGTVDSAADHEQVERFIRQPREPLRSAHPSRGLAGVRRARYTSVMLLLLSHR